MKKLSILALAFAGCFLGACSDDDGDNTPDFVGTYELTAYTAPLPIDYDDDGDSSSNLLNESNCFANSTLTIRSNGTYTSRYNGISIANGLSSCAATVETSGTWMRNGNTITTTPDGGGLSMEWTFSDDDDDTLTTTMLAAEYPTFNPDTDLYSYATGNVTLTYTDR